MMGFLKAVSRSESSNISRLCAGIAFVLMGMIQAQELESASKSPAPELALPVYRVAVVKDGDSWYFDAAVERLEAELTALAENRYTFEVETLNAGHDPVKVRALLLQASADPMVNVIYASGVMATENAKRMTEAERTKPIMAGAVQFSDIGGLISEGTSTVANFTFITEPKRVTADLELLKRLTDTSTIHIAIDRLIYGELDSLEQARAILERGKDLRVMFHPFDPTVENALRAIPTDAKAIYMGVQPRLEVTARKTLYQKLAERGAVTVSMMGIEEVKLGALAGLAPNNNAAISRLAALNIHQLLQGVSAVNLPVYLPVQDQLVINATAAKTAGWSPTYELALEANFLNRDGIVDGAPITLEKAMQWAAKNNADVIVAQEEERIRQQDTLIARSALLPQASFEATGSGTSLSDKISAMSPDYSHAGSFGAQLRQVLFNDELATNVKVKWESAVASSKDRLSSELDAMDAAAAAYLSVLTARSLYEIEKENLRLTQNNLQLSRLRIEIGSAEPSEVFRWEQDVARGRAALFQRDTDRANAVVELNRILGEPLGSQWNFTDIRLLDDDDYYFLDAQMKSMTTQEQFQRFGVFMRWQAVKNSPELASFDHLLGAQGEILSQKQRRYYLPEIAATAGAERVGSGSELSGTDAENQLGIGIQLSFPLFEGGRRKADIFRQQASIRQLAAQRIRAVQQIEQRTLTAYNNIGAAHPNILLSRRALTSAQKNYNAVLDKYSQGVASVLDLLDAQSALVGQTQQEANAVYAYLTQVHALQRSIAWFEFNKTPSQKAQFEALMERSLASEQRTVPAHQISNEVQIRAQAAIDAALPAPDPPTITPSKKVMTPTVVPPQKRRFFERFRRKR